MPVAALFAFKEVYMQKIKYSILEQQSLFDTPVAKSSHKKFISVFRVSLVKDRRVSFESNHVNNSAEAQSILRKLIDVQGQQDRENFCVVLLSAKNEIIGLNLCAIGGLSSATIHPREVLKPAILANSSALILCHNHPSGDPEPSEEDLAITKRIVQAASIMGIVVHEHLIISMHDDRYYSFADNGLIKQMYDEMN